MNLKLYYFETCPYCQKVLKFLKRNKLMEYIELKDTQNDKEAKKTLIEKGGKYQVPCLFIKEKPLYESEIIIKWFKNNISKIK